MKTSTFFGLGHGPTSREGQHTEATCQLSLCGPDVAIPGGGGETDGRRVGVPRSVGPWGEAGQRHGRVAMGDAGDDAEGQLAVGVRLIVQAAQQRPQRLVLGEERVQ